MKEREFKMRVVAGNVCQALPRRAPPRRAGHRRQRPLLFCRRGSAPRLVSARWPAAAPRLARPSMPGDHPRTPLPPPSPPPPARPHAAPSRAGMPECHTPIPPSTVPPPSARPRAPLSGGDEPGISAIGHPVPAWFNGGSLTGVHPVLIVATIDGPTSTQKHKPAGRRRRK